MAPASGPREPGESPRSSATRLLGQVCCLAPAALDPRCVTGRGCGGRRFGEGGGRLGARFVAGVGLRGLLSACNFFAFSVVTPEIYSHLLRKDPLESLGEGKVRASCSTVNEVCSLSNFCPP